MIRYFLLFIFSFSAFLGVAQSVIEPERNQRKDMRDAEKVALIWLGKLNTKKYQDCWNMLAEEARAQTSFEDWNAYFSTELMPELGHFKSRKYYLAEIENNIAGFPVGLYVTVRYQSVYTNTESVEEIILLGLLPDSKWVIHNYFIEYKLKDDNGEEPKSKLKKKHSK